MPRRWQIAILLLAVALAPSLEARGSRAYSGTRSTSGFKSSRSSAGRSPRISSGTSRISSSGRSSSPRAYSGSRTTRISSGSSRCSSCSRNSTGRISRSPVAKYSFERSNPCPSTGRTSGGCPGYVVDHVAPLKRGGADSPSNMQWQTKEAAKEKDRTE